MNPQQIQAWIGVGAILIQSGIATIAQVRSLVQLLHATTIADDDLNRILDAIADDAKRRIALARIDQGLDG